MIKKIGAVSIGVILGLVIAFARAGAFQLWGSDSAQNPPASPPRNPRRQNSPKRRSM